MYKKKVYTIIVFLFVYKIKEGILHTMYTKNDISHRINYQGFCC